MVFLCAIKRFKTPSNQIAAVFYSLLPSTKTAADVFLSDDSKAILHDSHRRIRRKGQLVKTCVRRRQVIIRLTGFAN